MPTAAAAMRECDDRAGLLGDDKIPSRWQVELQLYVFNKFASCFHCSTIPLLPSVMPRANHLISWSSAPAPADWKPRQPRAGQRLNLHRPHSEKQPVVRRPLTRALPFVLLMGHHTQPSLGITHHLSFHYGYWWDQISCLDGRLLGLRDCSFPIHFDLLSSYRCTRISQSIQLRLRLQGG